MDQNNPYDFIFQNGAPAGQPGQPGATGGGGSSTKKRALIVIVGFSVLLIVGLIAMSVIQSTGKEKFDDLRALAKTQRKIIYASELALDSSNDVNGRAYAATLETSVSSDLVALNKYLKSRGQEDLTKGISEEEDSAITKKFEAAVRNNAVDETFIDVTNELLVEYSNDLKTALGDSKHKNESTYLNRATANLSSIFKKS